MSALLERAVARLEAAPRTTRGAHELESIVTGLRNLPSRTETDARAPEGARAREGGPEAPPRRARRGRRPVARGDRRRGASSERHARATRRASTRSTRSCMEQSYRLAFWRVATEEINYRRFFDINDLAAIRMEDPAVFDDAHELLLPSRRRGPRAGRAARSHRRPLRSCRVLREAPSLDRTRRRIYLVAEKILSLGEELPVGWAIDGTTGYDFLVQASGVFVDRAAERAMTRLWHELTQRLSLLRRARARLEARDHALEPLERDPHARRSASSASRCAIAARATSRCRCFIAPSRRRSPRSPCIARTSVPTASARRTTSRSSAAPRASRSAATAELVPSVFDFLRDVLLLAREPVDEDDRAARTRVRDALPAAHRPGDGQERRGHGVLHLRAVRRAQRGRRRPRALRDDARRAPRRQRAAPRALAADDDGHVDARHEARRGRARAPRGAHGDPRDLGDVGEAVARDRRDRHTTTLDEETAPSVTDQYFFFQTALGAYPLLGGTETFITRLVEYAIKAAREAKQHTSWLAPNEAYENALKGFVTGMFSLEAFETSLETAANAIATHGASNGLGQVVLKVASPGIPDTYQGSELWELSPRRSRQSRRRRLRGAARGAALARGSEASGAPRLVPGRPRQAARAPRRPAPQARDGADVPRG